MKAGVTTCFDDYVDVRASSVEDIQPVFAAYRDVGIRAVVSISPGTGVLVEADISPDAPGGALSVVTDLGLRYPLVSRDVIGYLGYGGRPVVHLPAGLVSLLPAGPALDPATASSPAAVP